MRTRLRLLTALTTFVLAAPVTAHAEPAGPTDGVQPLERAHAHNDYEHQRPLFDALSHGFRSVEADVWLVDGELCIGHLAPDCSRTLESLYLKPLAQIAHANGGEIYDDDTKPLRLYVDVKDGGQVVWEVLAQRNPEVADGGGLRWWPQAVVGGPEVVIGLTYREGGCLGELSVHETGQQVPGFGDDVGDPPVQWADVHEVLLSG